jgi:hypothetical protein
MGIGIFLNIEITLTRNGIYFLIQLHYYPCRIVSARGPRAQNDSPSHMLKPLSL